MNIRGLPKLRRTGTPAPSRLVRRFGTMMANASHGAPILDVACGSGRNSAVLAALGCTVICMDNDLTRLLVHPDSPNEVTPRGLPGKLMPYQIDLVRDKWPFEPLSVGGIINVHFFYAPLLAAFESSLLTGCYCLFESIPGCGGNYLELPKAGDLKAAFCPAFEFVYYKEVKVGPPGQGRVTVRMVGRKRCVANLDHVECVAGGQPAKCKQHV